MLFQPDNFSVRKPKYRPSKKDLSFLVDVLDGYFKEYRLVDVWELDRSEINSQNYKIKLCINDKENYFLLRRFKTLRDREQIEFYLRLLKDLKDEGAEVVQVLKSKEETCCVETDNGIYSMFDFVEGDYLIPTTQSLISVAQSVGKMHNIFNILSANYERKISQLSLLSNTYFNIIKEYKAEDFEEVARVINNKSNLNSHDKLVLEKLSNILRIVNQIFNRKLDISQIPIGIIHSDLHPHNILMVGNKVIAITDFDSVRISQQSRDAAFAIYRFGRQFLVGLNPLDAAKIAPELTKIFIDNYSAVRPLDKKEIELMPFLLWDEFLRKLLFVLRGVYLENNYTWAQDLEKFLFAFEEIGYFWPDVKLIM